MIRLYVEDDLAAGRELRITGVQAHYLVDVMRLAVGGEVLVFNGREGEWRATLSRLSKSGWTLAPTVLLRTQAPTGDLELLMALIKRTRLETVVEKAAELGARRVRLVITERVKPARANLVRLKAIAIEAAEQTGRMEAPDIVPPEPLDRLLSAWNGRRRLMFCDEAGDAPPALQALRASPAANSWAILIGPEGGFSPAERAAIRATPAAVAVGLGPRVLRADTAALSAMTLWQAELGDWRGS